MNIAGGDGDGDCGGCWNGLAWDEDEDYSMLDDAASEGLEVVDGFDGLIY